jgi:carboxymethylenebutenolidase
VGAPQRCLVIAPDIHGLTPTLDQLVSDLAQQHQWSVCAVENWPGSEHVDRAGRLAMMSSVDDRRVLLDLELAADALGGEQVAVLGFCMGGMYALKAAGRSRRFDKAVAFYGMIRLPEGWRGKGQGEPLDDLTAGTPVPTLALVGGKDPYTPNGDVDALREVQGIEVVVYPDAGHAFAHDRGRPEHRPDDAQDAWQKAIEFLEAP